jgi:hypothetical protein
MKIETWITIRNDKHNIEVYVNDKYSGRLSVASEDDANAIATRLNLGIEPEIRFDKYDSLKLRIKID